MPRFVLMAVIVIASSAMTFGQTSYPMLMKLHPNAARIGHASEHELESRYSLFGADRVIISGEGVTGEVVTSMELKDGQKPPAMTKIKLRFDVAADAMPGVRDFRVMTPRGVSTLGQLVIVADEVILEAAKNNTPTEAQEITTPSAVCGVIETAEDVDFFKFTVDAGDSLNFHVQSMRLQDKIHDLQKHIDPILSLRNASGTTLATVDNVFAGDPFLSYTFEHAGEYFLEMRDVRYEGNRYWTYCVEIHPRPFVTNVHPMGVAVGSTTDVALVGTLLPEKSTVPLTVPIGHDVGSMMWAMTLSDGMKTPVPVVVTDLPAVVETDADNNTPNSAQAVEIPAGISGRMETAADLDCFSFAAKKGERFSFEVIAHRHHSALDSRLRILNESGKSLIENDDLRLSKRTFSDSWIENWTAPADGTYFVEIGDLHLRGGEEFVYFLKATRAEPYFELYLDTDKTQLTPHTAGVIFANVVRKNGFTGAIDLEIDGLPEGITATCGRILDGERDGCIILKAAPKTPITAANVTVRGIAKNADGKPTHTAVAVPYQETYQPGGGRGHWPVQMHTVALGEASDIRGITLSETEMTLKPGESKTLDITIDRADGFDKNVQLDLLFRHLSSTYANPLPAGVSIDGKNSQTVLTKGATKGKITLKADAKAKPASRQQVSVMANISLNFVMKATYSSEPLFVSIAE